MSMFPYYQSLEQIDHPYGCCTDIQPNDIQILENSYHTLAATCIDSLTTKAYGGELFGKKAVKDYYNNINNFYYLLFLLKIIWYEQQNYYAINGEYRSVDYYDDIYDFDCIRKTFKCYGCDIMPLLSLFEMNYLIPESDGTGLDGIGYMALTPNTGSDPDNRVF